MNMLTRYLKLPKSILIIIVARIINCCGSFIFPFLTLILIENCGMDKSEIGFFVTVASISSLLGTLLGGYITDKFGRKNIIISSSILSAGSVFSFWCVFVPYFLILSLFFNSIANVSINALMLDKTDESNRGDALTLFYYASNIGKAIGPMLAGILFNRYAKLLLIGDAITTIISVIPIYIYVNDTYQIKVKKKVNKINFKEIYEYRYILIVMITSIILNIMYSQINYSVPICINSNFNQNSSNIYGLMITINCIVVLFLTLFIRPLIHNRNIGRNLFFANTLYLIGFSFMYIVHTYIYLYILTIVYTIGEIILELSSQIYIGDNTPTVYRGRVGSMIRFAIVTGLTLGPFLGALFLKYNSINNMYKFILLMWGIANVVIVLLKIIKNKQGELYDNKKM